MTRRLLPAVLLLCLATACGVPTGGEPTVIAPADVPYGLADPSPTPARADPAESSPAASDVYLLADDQRLVPRGRDVSAADREQALQELLGELAEGPTSDERGEQLSTLLPPDVELTVEEITGDTATIDIAGPADLPSGTEGGRAVGQVVLTATSIPGVAAVLLTVDGSPVDVPLPSGELTPEPVTAADYEVFLSAQLADGTVAPPFRADTSADRGTASADARLTVSDIRIGHHDRFDRVVFEVAGTGTPGWDVRYVTAADVPTAGGPGGLGGEAVLQVTVTGTGQPDAPGVERYAGRDPLSVADTEVITSVDLHSSAEDRTVAFVGTTERTPFRVYRMDNPSRVVLEVAATG